MYCFHVNFLHASIKFTINSKNFYKTNSIIIFLVTRRFHLESTPQLDFSEPYGHMRFSVNVFLKSKVPLLESESRVSERFSDFNE
jgi:hypothetical protein